MSQRIPKAKADVTGASLKNPRRFIGRNEPTTIPLGEPSDYLKDGARRAWLSFTAELPWLMESDRAMVEVAATMRARLRSGDGVGVNVLQAYSSVLSKLAATPVDRTRVNFAIDDDDDLADKYFKPVTQKAI